MVPADPWLYTLLNSRSFLVYGALTFNVERFLVTPSVVLSLMQRANTDRPILHWFGEIYRSYGDSPAKSIEELNGLSDHFLDEMARNGVKALGPATASHVISMGAPDFDPNLAYDRDRFAHRYASNYESLQEVRPVLLKENRKTWITSTFLQKGDRHASFPPRFATVS